MNQVTSGRQDLPTAEEILERVRRGVIDDSSLNISLLDLDDAALRDERESRDESEIGEPKRPRRSRGRAA